MNVQNAVRRRGSSAPYAEPNIIPFVDVLLVLLVIFMATAPAPSVDVPLDLPTGASIPVVEIAPIVVDVERGGDGLARYSIGGRGSALSDLAAAVELAAPAGVDARADMRLFVRADQGVAYGAVVAALDQLNHDGFARVGLFAQTADPA